MSTIPICHIIEKNEISEEYGPQTSPWYFIFLGNVFAPYYDGLVNFLPHDVAFCRAETPHSVHSSNN